MHRLLIKLLVAMATFTAGVSLTPRPITFSGGYSRSGFGSQYRSSDGRDLRYSCFQYASTAEAVRNFHQEIRPNHHYIGSSPLHLVEHTVTFDGNGNEFSERAVLDGQIYWTEGPRFHIILAPKPYGLLFESSRTWASEGCWTFSPRDDAAENDK
jgi:hypothetical protein